VAGSAACIAGGSGLLSAQNRLTYPPLDRILRIEQPRLAIGDEHRDGPALFGTITGVAMDGAGNVYVLDGIDHSVRAFSPTGTHLGSAGRPGRGPGDLNQPLSLWHDGVAKLYVVDRNEGISVFDTRDGSPRYSHRFGAELRPTAMCVLDRAILVAALRDGGVLHELSSGHVIRRSMGELFRRDTHPEIQATFDREQLVMTCDAERGRIFVAEGHHQLVRAYDGGGRVLWQTSLPDYSGYRVAPDRRLPNAVAVFWGEFTTRTLMLVEPDLLVIQAHHQTRRRDPSRSGALTPTDHGIVTYVLSASTGAVLTRQYGVPFFLAATNGNEVAAYHDEPFPRVFLARVTAAR
jgi:sugar lactone lactonase YvrE